MRFSEIFEDQTIKLPEDVAKAFAELGDLQRGEPESAMLKVQHAMGGGVLSFAVEHTGDLTHRMSHMAPQGIAGRSYVHDKASKVLRMLRNLYGFEREMNENIAANARYRNIDEGMLRKKIDAALARYAAAHEKLPVYNKVQWMARQAAIELGHKNFEHAALWLEKLKELSESDSFAQKAFEFKRDSEGHLMRYKP
jgi:hypothetical protein